MPGIFSVLAELEEKNGRAALCLIIRTQGSTPRHASSKMLVYPDGHILGTVGGGEVENRVIQEALKALEDGKPRWLSYNMSDPARGDAGVCGGQVEVYVEPILPKPVIVVVGAGHVGKAVAHLAKWLGFRVVVNDDRPGFAESDVIPDADEYYPCSLAELPVRLAVTPWHYLVLTTQGVDVDVAGLPAVLETPAAYIGVIGSRRRWAITRQKLEESGILPEKLARIKSPIGLDIHAETPEEIAVSILGEIIRMRNLPN
jgi:xanthine dehydrogenase accessory factor